MAKVMVSARLDGELSGWAKKYAKQRNVSLATVIEAALREFREACQGGAPEMEARTPRHRESAGGSVQAVRSQVPGSSVMQDRQARLRKQMGWDQ